MVNGLIEIVNMATLATVNNNPGNLKDPATGQFRQFSTPHEGFAALLNDLEGKKTGSTTTGLGPSSTLYEFAKVYAPEKDRNNPAQYTVNIANMMGVSPQTQLKDLDTLKWGKAIASAEDRSSPYGSGQFNPTPFSGGKGAPVINFALPPERIPTQDTGFAADVSRSVSKAANKASQAIQQGLTGQINPFSSVLQTVGAGAGGVTDIGLNVLSAVTPDIIEKPITGAISGVAQKALETQIGQKALQAYEKFKRENPETAGNIGAALDIASVIPTVKAAQATARAAQSGIRGARFGLQEGIVATKKALGRTASLQNEARDVLALTPKEMGRTARLNIIRRGRAEVSPSGVIGVAETPRNARMYAEAAGVVRKGETAVENANRVLKEIGTVATKLSDDIKAQPNPPRITRAEMLKIRKEGIAEATGSVLTRQAKVTARETYEDLFKKFQEFLPKDRDITPDDIFGARKQLDDWIETTLSKPFDDVERNARKVALRSIRQKMNSLVAEKVPEVAVRESLARQTALYDAIENLAIKGERTLGSTRTQRFFQRRPIIGEIVKENVRGAIPFGLGAYFF